MSADPVDPVNARTAPDTPQDVELRAVTESLRRREQLLAASARASRRLLEAADAMSAIPDALRLIGEAAGVDRVTLVRSQTGPAGERLLVLTHEWVAEGVPVQITDPASLVCNERDFPLESAELREGRSVCRNWSVADDCQTCTVMEGIGTKSKAIVPIFVDGQFSGVVGFDNTRQRRSIDLSELSALETAAGVIGAVLHRERLVETVRREREQAAQQRMAELARANAVIRANLERLASERDLGNFVGHVLLEATRQLNADGGGVIVADEGSASWSKVAYVTAGQSTVPAVPDCVRSEGSALVERFGQRSDPLYVDLVREQTELWPGARAKHEAAGHVGLIVYPLVFGGRNVGFILLTFTRPDAAGTERSELLVALAQQATLAIEITRLAYSAKRAAVLTERNRIGREIHDGLAQAFTGILMQLGAAEELGEVRRSSRLTLILTRVRDLAREGLGEARRSVLALAVDRTGRTGLPRALQQLAERSTVPGGVTVRFEGGEATEGLRPEHQHELLRIAQEAVSNAVRHADPSTVDISMTGDRDHWSLSVADDGRGLREPAEDCARRGFGLASMQQRAEAIGGDWRIESAPGTGTRIRVRVPRYAQ
jgi:signal transduction histidine kinase